MNSSRKIAIILTNAANEVCYNHTAFVQAYFNKHWTGKSMQLTAEEPTIPIMLVLSDDFPAKAADIKKDFVALPSALARHPGFSTLTIQHPGKLGQEAEAKKEWLS